MVNQHFYASNIVGIKILSTNHRKSQTTLQGGGGDEFPRDGSNIDLDALAVFRNVEDKQKIKGVLKRRFPKPKTIFQNCAYEQSTENSTDYGSGICDVESELFKLKYNPNLDNVNADSLLHRCYKVLGEGNASIDLNGKDYRKKSAIQGLAEYLGLFLNRDLQTVRDFQEAHSHMLSWVAGSFSPDEKYRDWGEALYDNKEKILTPRNVKEVCTKSKRINGKLVKYKTFNPMQTVFIWDPLFFALTQFGQKAASKPEKRAVAPRNVWKSGCGIMGGQKYMEDCQERCTNIPICTNGKDNDTIFSDLEGHIEAMSQRQPFKLNEFCSKPHPGSSKKMEMTHDPIMLTISEDATKYNQTITDGELMSTAPKVMNHQSDVAVLTYCNAAQMSLYKSGIISTQVRRKGFSIKVAMGEILYSVLKDIKTVQDHGADYFKECILTARKKELKASRYKNLQFTLWHTDMMEQDIPIILMNPERFWAYLSVITRIVYNKFFNGGGFMGMGNLNKTANLSQSYNFIGHFRMLEKYNPLVTDMQLYIEEEVNRATDLGIKLCNEFKFRVGAGIDWLKTNVISVIRKIQEWDFHDDGTINPLKPLLLYKPSELRKMDKNEREGLQNHFREKGFMFNDYCRIMSSETFSWYNGPSPFFTPVSAVGQKSDDAMVVLGTFRQKDQLNALTQALGSMGDAQRKTSLKKTTIDLGGCRGTLYAQVLHDKVFEKSITSSKRAIIPGGISLDSDYAQLISTCQKQVSTGEFFSGYIQMMLGLVLFHRHYRFWGIHTPLVDLGERTEKILAIHKKFPTCYDVPATLGGCAVFLPTFTHSMQAGIVEAIFKQEQWRLYHEPEGNARLIDTGVKGVIEKRLLDATCITGYPQKEHVARPKAGCSLTVINNELHSIANNVKLLFSLKPGANSMEDLLMTIATPKSRELLDMLKKEEKNNLNQLGWSTHRKA